MKKITLATLTLIAFAFSVSPSPPSRAIAQPTECPPALTIQFCCATIAAGACEPFLTICPVTDDCATIDEALQGLSNSCAICKNDPSVTTCGYSQNEARRAEHLLDRCDISL